MISIARQFALRSKLLASVETLTGQTFCQHAQPHSSRRLTTASTPVSSLLQSPAIIAGLSLILGLFFSAVALNFFSKVTLFPALVMGIAIPPSIRRRQADRQAAQFAEDYPSLLLSIASSLKAGVTPYLALERASNLLPRQSPLRTEVEMLIAKLHTGQSAENALSSFAKQIQLPELELFRSAFTIVLEQGGRFAPTLERLAQVTRDRIILTATAHVSTSIMRMTSNIVLLLAPFLLLVISMRQHQFWETLLRDPTANLLTSIGISLIITGYFTLQTMSAFRP